MKKILKALITTGFLITTISTSYAAQNPNTVSIHASACQPIFLTQALRFRMMWTRDGVFNPNLIGSGQFFWVACPVPLTDDGSKTENSSVFVSTFYKERDPNLEKRTFCFAKLQEIDNGNFIKGSVISEKDRSNGTGPTTGFIDLGNLFNRGTEFRGQSHSAAVVCQLHPQAGIGDIIVRFE